MPLIIYSNFMPPELAFNESAIRDSLEAIQMPEAQIDQAVQQMKQAATATQGKEEQKRTFVNRVLLEQELRQETDWRKKASIAASIISNDLD